MKKLLLALLFSPSLAYAAGAGGINLTPDMKAILRTTNTWTAAQTFTSATFTGNITVNGCTGCGAGGGGGGGGSGFIFNGSQNLALSTIAVPGFPVAYSNGFATITVINSSPTWTGTHTFTSSAVFTSSLSIANVGTSQVGFIAPSATFSYLSVSGSSIAFKTYTAVFASAPVAGQHLFASQVTGGNVVFAGGGDNAGSGGAATSIPPGTDCLQFMAANLIAGGTDFAPADSTSTRKGLLPQLTRRFSDSTTNYMGISFMTHPRLKLDGNATFYATIQPKTPVASKNVQLAWYSTGTINGEVFNFVKSTAAIFAMPGTQGTRATVSWSARVTTDLEWLAGMNVEGAFARSHDTNLLTNTELVGDLYWINCAVCYNYDP